jgi:AraC-like DNA-binding protein
MFVAGTAVVKVGFHATFTKAMDPETVLSSFCRLHQVAVTVHDLDGRFVHVLPPERLRHVHRLCQAAKEAGHEAACIRFDVNEMQAAARAFPTGLVKVCHAGLVELVVPWNEKGRLRWLLFAGPWQDTAVTADLRARRSETQLHGALPTPPANLTDLHEALRCLAARLASWQPASLASGATRQEQITTFLRQRLEDLAAELGLSPSRTSHVVAAITGEPFARLLARTRLSAAELLLRHTDLPIGQVALRSGHGDLSHFHAVFRNQHRTTPAAWRRTVRTP